MVTHRYDTLTKTITRSDVEVFVNANVGFIKFNKADGSAENNLFRLDMQQAQELREFLNYALWKL